MAAANAGWQAYQTGKGAQNLANGTTNAKQVSISITYGEQQNRQTTQVQANQAQTSQIQAGGKTTLIAGGAGEQSNINITGSDVSGKAGTTLIADNHIKLQSAKQDGSEQSKNKSSGWNAGVAIQIGDGISLGITAGGNLGKGKGQGENTTHRHTHIGSMAGKTTIRSGGDTTLKGAQLIGKGVQADTRNLHIESVQDTETYQSKQQNGNVQVTVGYGFSASGSYSQSKVKADHASVTEQSGIYAGEDGYQIKVRDNTDLKGGIITSGKSAEDKGKNLFQTATLTASDIQNHSRYEGKSFGIGASVAISGESMGQNRPADSGPGIRLIDVSKGQNNNNAIGYGSDGDSKNSTTRSGINTRNIHITDEAGQLARTARTAKETEARIHTGIDTETVDQHSGRLKNSFDKDAVAKEINLQREITQEFGKNAAQTTAAVSDKLGNTQSYERYQAAKTLLEAELQNTDSETEKAAIRATLGQVNAYLAENQSRYHTWKEGGIGRSMLHGAAGGLTTGSLGGILAGGGTSLAAPYLDKAAENLGPAGKAAVNALGGAAIGYAAGGNVGTAAVGANVDWNNRQLHPDERAWIKQNAKAFAKQENGGKEPTAQQVADAQKRLVHQAVKETDLFWMLTLEKITDLPAQDFLKKAGRTFLNEDGRQQRFFTTEGKQFVRPEVFAPDARSDLVFYRNNLHSSKNSNITQGAKDLASKFAKKSWEEKKQNPLKTIIEQSFTYSPLYVTGSMAVDTFKDAQNCAKDFGRCWDNVTEAFQSPGAGAASLILNDLQPIYGQDVRGAQAALIGLQSVENLTTAVGAGKVLKQGVKPVINSFKRMLGKDTWGEASAGRKTGEMSVLDGEMAGENKPRKQTNNVEYEGGNRLATHERVNRNIQETRGGSQSSQFKAHAQRERENKTGLDFNHFIGGDINKKGTVTGGHSLTRGDVRVIQQTSAPDKHGVYQATVEIKKPDGSWEMKKGRSGKPMTNHSMFPKYWDEARIRAEVTSAWEKRKMVNQNKWEGKSSSGVWIEGFITPRGTAYPIYGR